jgi:geranylgeranyl pyrophosphate synthase
MVAGQVLDISGGGMLDAAQVARIHSCKTGAMIKAAVRMGAIVAGAGAKIIAALTEYAESLGLAFQIIDDILDVTATSQQLGKNPGSDEKKGKQTFVTVCGLGEARKMAASETARAVQALQALGGDYSLLQDLAEYVGQRHN